MSADERRERDKLRKRNMRVSAGRPQTSEFVRDVSHTEAEAEATTKAEQNTKNAPPRSAQILSSADYVRLQKHNAYVGARLRVPHKLHGDFVAALGGQEPDTVLRGWYATVDAEIEGSGEAIVPDVWKWLDARFKAWAVSTAVDPEWAKIEAWAKG